MNKLIFCYRFLQLISIDIALGSAILSMSIARVLNVDIPLSVSIALFLCVWMIYTLDHLLDARKVKGPASMNRHVFHQKNCQLLFFILIIIALTSLVLLFFIPSQILFFGAITAGVVSCYFILTWWLKVFIAKELLIALLYSIGVCLAPFVLFGSLNYLHLIIFLEIMLLAFSNLLLFSYMEEREDRKDGYHSWATVFGTSKTKSYIYGAQILALLMISIGIIFLTEDITVFIFHLTLSMMWLVLTSIFFFKDYMVKNEQYRLLGDIIFVLPGIILLI